MFKRLFFVILFSTFSILKKNIPSPSKKTMESSPIRMHLFFVAGDGCAIDHVGAGALTRPAEQSSAASGEQNSPAGSTNNDLWIAR